MMTTRSHACCMLFAAGALAGGVATAWFQPLPLSAQSGGGNASATNSGVNAEIAKLKSDVAALSTQNTALMTDVDALKVKTSLITLDSGKYKVMAPTEICVPDSDADNPAMKVCGTAVHENLLGEKTLVVNDTLGSTYAVKIKAASDELTGGQRTALKVEGNSALKPVDITMPIERTLEIEGSTLLYATDAMTRTAPLLEVTAPEADDVSMVALLPQENVNLDPIMLRRKPALLVDTRGTPADQPRKALETHGDTQMVDSTLELVATEDSPLLERLSLHGPRGAVCISEVAIELLVRCAPGAGRRASLLWNDETGRSELSTDEVTADNVYGTFVTGFLSRFFGYETIMPIEGPF